MISWRGCWVLRIPFSRLSFLKSDPRQTLINLPSIRRFTAEAPHIYQLFFSDNLSFYCLEGRLYFSVNRQTEMPWTWLGHLQSFPRCEEVTARTGFAVHFYCGLDAVWTLYYCLRLLARRHWPHCLHYYCSRNWLLLLYIFWATLVFRTFD